MHTGRAVRGNTTSDDVGGTELVFLSTISASYNPRTNRSSRVFIVETLSFVHIARNTQPLLSSKYDFYFVGHESRGKRLR